MKTETTHSIIRTVTLALSALLYMISLVLPAVLIEPFPQPPDPSSVPATMSGFEVLKVAWEWPFTIQWSANIYYAASSCLLLLGMLRIAFYAAAGGLVLAMSSLISYNPSDFRTGFYVWVLAGAVLSIGSWFGGGNRRERTVAWGVEEPSRKGSGSKDGHMVCRRRLR